jgi:hypothetical protein
VDRHLDAARELFDRHSASQFKLLCAADSSDRCRNEDR